MFFSVVIGLLIFFGLFACLAGSRFYKKLPDRSERKELAMLGCMAAGCLAGWVACYLHPSDAIATLALLTRFSLGRRL